MCPRPVYAGQPLAVLRNGLPFTFDAPSYSLEFGDQGPFASDLLRVRYSSLTQPSSTYDINMASGE
jgi:protease II